MITYAIDHVVCCGGNCTAQGKCWYEEVCPTLKRGGVHAVMQNVTIAATLKIRGGATLTAKARKLGKERLSNGKRAGRSE